MTTLNDAQGTVVSKTEIAPGVMEIEYRLPNKSYLNKTTGLEEFPKKTVYDPKIYSDAKMADMAQEAAAKGMIRYQLGEGKKLPNGSVVVDVQVNGVNFNVPINNGRVPSVFPGKKVQ